jgi:hypothetical protein
MLAGALARLYRSPARLAPRPREAAITKPISSIVVGMNRVILILDAYRSSCGGSEKRAATMTNVRGTCLFRALDLTLDQRQGFRRRQKSAYS